MPTFQKCPAEINYFVNDIIREYPNYQLLLNTEAKIDLVFAYCDRDEESHEPLNDALKHHGVKATAIARSIGTKDRAMGRGDCEIAIDGDWWADASVEERKALLDHELYHFVVKVKKGVVQRDDLGRPMIKMRPHDVDVGWFKLIAERHGNASQEQQQAKKIMDGMGQYFWPVLYSGAKALDYVKSK